MKKLMLAGFLVGMLAVAPAGIARAASAQDASKDQHPAETSKAAEKSVYRLEFVVKETEGSKTINSRTYTMSVEDGDTGRVRVGNRIPYTTGKGDLQYFEVGINIDCRLRDHESYVLLENTQIEITSIVKEASAESGPIVRSARTSVAAAVTPGKASVIATMDDVSSNRRYEVEVTATKIK